MIVRRALLPWERQAILDAYKANEKIDAIAEEFGVVREYPSILARRCGVPPRSRGRPKVNSGEFMSYSLK